MRKLIRCKATQAFLTSEDTWTKDFQKAHYFADLQAAFAINTLPSSDVEIYYSFDPGKPSPWDFTLSAS